MLINNGGVWTGNASFYAWYDSNTNRLWFRDGSFWLMGCVSAGGEPDAGTMYPTLVEDSNGNQIIIHYMPGAGVNWTDSSARISSIEDARAVPYTDSGTGDTLYHSYSFTYTTGGNGLQYLSSITSYVNTPENCTFTINQGQPIYSPSGASFSTTSFLSAITFNGLGYSYHFTYDTTLNDGDLWFVVALLPNIGLLQAGRQSIADRFTHLAMMGLVIALASSLSNWKTVVALPVCVAVALCAALTIRQIGFWHDSVRLFEHTIAVADCDYTRGVLAATLLAERRYAEAEPHLREAIRLAPDRAEYHNNLANVLLKTARIEPAAAEAATALRLAPEDLSANETMGQVLFRQADYQGALDRFTRAVALGAEKAPVAAALNDMGASVASSGNPRAAEPLIRKALELDSALPQARRNLALVLEDESRFMRAKTSLPAQWVAAFKTALPLGPVLR